jgi:hypothetical protein
MADELHNPGARRRGPESSAFPVVAHSTHLALINSLQSLRERVLERLASLETLVRDRSAVGPAENASAGLERNLEAKLAELAEAERKLNDQASRREKEWSASLNQLESDRRSLAEAWERVEHERIAYASAPEHHHRSGAQGHGPQNGVSASLSRAGTPVTTRSVAVDSDSNHAVAQAILRQFQTLCSDVRRNAEERRDPRSKGSRAES